MNADKMMALAKENSERDMERARKELSDIPNVDEVSVSMCALGMAEERTRILNLLYTSKNPFYVDLAAKIVMGVTKL